MISKRSLTQLFFALSAYGCQGGGGSSVDFAASDQDIQFHQPPDDSSEDPGTETPWPTNRLCQSFCDSWDQADCSAPEQCPATCREILAEEACGVLQITLVGCVLDAGECPSEDLDASALEGCLEEAREYTRCSDSLPAE